LKAAFAQLLKELYVKKPRCPSPFSQDTSLSPYLESDEFSLHLPIHYNQDSF